MRDRFQKVKFGLYVSQFVPELIHTCFKKLGCVSEDWNTTLEEFEGEEQEILGMSTMVDIYGFILRNKMIINNIVAGNTNIDEKNIQIRIAQMRAYVTYTE
jgi:hypothetical protein